MHTLQNARSKERFQLHDLQMPDQKVVHFLIISFWTKVFSNLEILEQKEIQFFVFGSDCSRNPFIISTHLRWNIGLIEKSFYDKHPHDGWIWQAGSSCNGSILRSIWLQIWSFLFFEVPSCSTNTFLNHYYKCMYDHIMGRLWKEKWHNLSSWTLMFHWVPVPVPPPSLPPPNKKKPQIKL